MIFSYSYLSVYQPCICEISQLMNNPKSITDQTKIEGVFNQKLNFPGYGYMNQGLVILTKILNAHKNLIFMAFISRKQNGNI